MKMNNSTLNGTVVRCPPYVDITTEEKSLKSFAYCCVMLMSITGNALVVLIVYKNRSMQTTVNYLIVNMALSDLLQSFIAIPQQIVLLIAGVDRSLVEGNIGEFFCKCIPFLLDISVGVSILSLVLIAFDRFLGVVYPIHASSISKRMHSFNLSLTWIISTGFHSVYFFAFRLDKRDGLTFCIYSWKPLPDPEKSAEVYFLVTSSSLFIFPLILLIVLYSTILFKLTRRKMPGNNSFRNQQRIAKRNRNVLRMVLAVVIVFALCWLPLNTLAYIQRYVWTAQTTPCDVQDYFYWGLFVAYSNASMTPCLYFLFSENYRQGLKRLLCGRVTSISKTRTSVQSRPRNLFGGRETSVSDSRRGMSLRSLPPTNLHDDQFNCIPRLALR